MCNGCSPWSRRDAIFILENKQISLLIRTDKSVSKLKLLKKKYEKKKINKDVSGSCYSCCKIHVVKKNWSFGDK